MIDVIIPAYNAHDTIGRTLASIAMQSIVDKLNVVIVATVQTKTTANLWIFIHK